jgi:acetylglutamate kinase
VFRAVADRETIEFVRKQAGAYTDLDLLPLVRAKREKARTVKDGNVITAGDIASSIDFGLSAGTIQLAAEGVFCQDPRRA